MTPIPGTEDHEPWLQLLGAVGFVLTMGVGAALSSLRAKKDKAEAEVKTQTGAGNAMMQSGAVFAVQKSTSQYTEEIMVQTLISLQETVVQVNVSLERLVSRLDADAKREEEEDRREEMMKIIRDELKRGVDAKGGAVFTPRTD